MHSEIACLNFLLVNSSMRNRFAPVQLKVCRYFYNCSRQLQSTRIKHHHKFHLGPLIMWLAKLLSGNVWTWVCTCKFMCKYVFIFIHDVGKSTKYVVGETNKDIGVCYVNDSAKLICLCQLDKKKSKTNYFVFVKHSLNECLGSGTLEYHLFVELFPRDVVLPYNV